MALVSALTALLLITSSTSVLGAVPEAAGGDANVADASDAAAAPASYNVEVYYTEEHAVDGLREVRGVSVCVFEALVSVPYLV